ncbi:hypothetical protein ASPZODRAFT_17626 [Penicilliopsis zonata CBS 506.65]|uniref:Cwf19-like C-terminal domain-containing protein n=1 Tax=Penicilliopsis zonata CBS 506.65 TaxID=1073090 RepID=A0A1L9SDW9_9EURO|nr:hypothetical protein ASPZODRAFT_17626 [Penicilliopsis zonata CBS 506.65]OJJ45410.1 hypothetical protein ASPZODRAFT_17626 [Penicilliopsis zonata CBS 506.65]
MASKIIVIGDVGCELRDVFTKLAKLQVKQNFSFAIVAGDLFGDCSTEHELEEITALLQGNILVPLPTYFTLGSRPLPTRVVEKIEADDEVCPNLYFLGKRGTLKTAEGVRIVALGGQYGAAAGNGDKATQKYLPSFTEFDAKALYGAHNADILVTSQWPRGVRTGSKVSLPEGSTPPEEVQCVADLCSTLKPRYHLSTSGAMFFEREPFFHLPSEDQSPDAKPLTRFISLAAYNNPSKQKWMYAFSLDPKAPVPLSVPVGATATPFAPIQPKRKGLASQKESFSRFAVEDDSNRPRKRARAPPPGPEQCFFCLSNPNIATHLITSIGNESYLTTAKGPLPTAKTFPSLDFPGHMLIVPFSHSPTLNLITDPEARSSTFREMQRYRDALHSMLRSRGSADALGAVTWEVSRGNGIHVHWQFLPVPADLVSRGLVEAAFKVEAENLRYPKFEKPSSQDEATEPGDFFRVWIWRPDSPPAGGEQVTSNDKNSEAANLTTLLLPLSTDFRFDLQFGRRVMAKLLQLERRMNWRDDVQTQEAEEADAEAFKEAFKEFDFTLE